MGAWSKPRSLIAAFQQANRIWPGRNTREDGHIGDADHASRDSDHNPAPDGVIHAYDLTHDPANGPDCNVLADHLVTVRDARVKYIIWNRRIIFAGTWAWQPYVKKKGRAYNPHDKHMHVSIKYTTAAENDVSEWWDVGDAPARPGTPPPATPVTPPARPGAPAAPSSNPPYPGHTVQRKSTGAAVTAVQQRLKERGWRIAVDGDFGAETDRVVTAFQQRKGLKPEGVVGPATWRALWAPVGR